MSSSLHNQPKDDFKSSPLTGVNKQKGRKRRLLPSKGQSSSTKGRTRTGIGSENNTDKRRKGPYVLFFQEKRRMVQQDNPNLSSREIVKAIGKLWNALTPEERKIYQDRIAAAQSVAALPVTPNSPIPAMDPFTLTEAVRTPAPAEAENTYILVQAGQISNPLTSRVSIESYDEAGKIKSFGKSPSMRSASAYLDIEVQCNHAEQDVPE
ncbi:hypothetical protein SpCBS45565_g06456 [Spizellomyces sp. 'palustris']|nr:hypothetical protein SpCBS45565_g06456 [Spizellomyces sp. 'palustris']